MGCFTACIGGGCNKKRKHLKSCHTPLPDNDAGLGSYQQLESVSVKPDVIEAGPDLKKEKVTLRSVLGTRKKVSFNLNVRTYELISSNDYSECEEEERHEKIENEKVGDEGINKESMSAYPSSYRYKNFVDFEEDDGEDEDEDEYDDCLEDCLDDEDHELDHSIDGKAVIGMSDDDRFGNAHSVLRPVENTAQWRAVKVKTSARPKHLCNENVALDERVHTSMQQQEIRVDASLSIWISGSGQHNLIKAQTI